MSRSIDPAERLARELARETLFLPERWRLWLFQCLREDLLDVDLERHRFEVLNTRMSEAVKALERVAKHLGLKDEEGRLALTMREFDAAPEKVRQGWKARRVADAIRGSWQLAKGVAFADERLPVTPERQWERSKELSRKRREGAFALNWVEQWLATKPGSKTKAAYTQWSKTQNQNLEPGQKPVLQADAVWRQWPFPWREIVKAVEEQRLPRDAEETADGAVGGMAAPELDAKANGKQWPRPQAFILDPRLRARRLRSARLARGQTLKDLAEETGLDPSRLGKLESGEIKQPSFESIAKLAEALGLSLNDFVSED